MCFGSGVVGVGFCSDVINLPVKLLIISTFWTYVL